MKRVKSEYEYWKWLLLEKHTKLAEEKEHRGVVAIYNPLEKTIFRYDFNKRKTKTTNWKGIDWLLENVITDFLTIGELEKFYISLPKNHKDLFWDYVYGSANREKANYREW